MPYRRPKRSTLGLPATSKRTVPRGRRPRPRKRVNVNGQAVNLIVAKMLSSRRGRKHRSGKCDCQQAGAKQDKSGNGHREETVRSDFFAHGTPPTARKSDCHQDQLHTLQAIAGSHCP
jgi:hypothetical protein